MGKKLFNYVIGNPPYQKVILVLNGLGRLLEARKHGPLAAGQVLAGISMLADLRQHVLHQAELVRHKGSW